MAETFLRRQSFEGLLDPHSAEWPGTGRRASGSKVRTRMVRYYDVGWIIGPTARILPPRLRYGAIRRNSCSITFSGQYWRAPSLWHLR